MAASSASAPYPEKEGFSNINPTSHEQPPPYLQAGVYPSIPGDGSNNPAYGQGPPVHQLGSPYPQQYPQQPGAVGYYPNQPVPGGYPPQPYQQQQQPGMVVIGAPQPTVIVQTAPYASYCGMIVLACLVYWFCNWLFGLVAFVLAVIAENTKMSDPNGARNLGKASMWVSIAGIIITVLLIIIVVAISFGSAAKASSYSSSYSSSSGRYVSASSCCTAKGYEYPGYGTYCYGNTRYSYGSCSGYNEYSISGKCYSSRYSLSASLCCYSSEYYYSTSSNTCS